MLYWKLYTSHLAKIATKLERKFKIRIHRDTGDVNFLFEKEKNGEIDI